MGLENRRLGKTTQMFCYRTLKDQLFLKDSFKTRRTVLLPFASQGQ